ncbi:MAG: DUF1553 domain-containing protein [Acidobacteria bacterium]|nr:DUF1553 domain-containing protein [Acidobacteriota bacterium]
MRKLLVLSLVVGVSGFAQELTPEARERTERAHRAIEQTGPTPSEIAEQITAEAASLRPGEASPAPVARRNFIDERVFGRIERDGIPHAPLSNDEEFVRRAYLDAVGRIPTIEESLAFVQDADPAKREKLIDQLVDSEDFVHRWSYYFEDLFRAGNRMASGKNLFHFWVEEWLRLDRSYADVVRDLLTQSAKTSHSAPGALYFARDFVKAKDDPDTPDAEDIVNRPDALDEFAITSSKVLLGLNIGCFSCHDGAHHLEQVNLFSTSKTREEFFQQAAFFGNTRMVMNWENGFQVPTEYTVDDIAEGYPTTAESIVRVPRTGGSNTPKFILSDESPRPGENPREALARILTADIQFSRALTNRIWAELMGVGIVEPVDDFDLKRYYPSDDLPEGWTVQPKDPALLDDLAKDFQAGGFSFKRLVRRIMNSSAYQLSSKFDGEWKPEYGDYFARKYVRLLGPTQLHDAIVTATAKPGEYEAGVVEVGMARDMLDPAEAPGEVAEFMRAFGQQIRDEMPTRVPSSSMQAMLMMNSDVVLDRVKAQGASRVEQLLDGREQERITAAQAIRAATGRDAEEAEIQIAVERSLVEKIYRATLSRRPLEKEMAVALGELERHGDRGLENLQWALLNSPEFIFNY